MERALGEHLTALSDDDGGLQSDGFDYVSVGDWGRWLESKTDGVVLLLSTGKQARNLDSLCPMGIPLRMPGSERPYLCGTEVGQPKCPLLFDCIVQDGNFRSVSSRLSPGAFFCPYVWAFFPPSSRSRRLSEYFSPYYYSNSFLVGLFIGCIRRCLHSSSFHFPYSILGMNLKLFLIPLNLMNDNV